MDDAETGNPILANLFGLNLWANLTLIDACAILDPSHLDADDANLHGTIRATLWRAIEAEHRFLAALNGEADAGSKTLSGSPKGSLSTLRVHALDSGEGLIAWAESVAGDPMLSGRWVSGPYALPASLFAGEALLQAQTRRSRIEDALTRAGIGPPDLSAWAWWQSLGEVGMETSTI